MRIGKVDTGHSAHTNRFAGAHRWLQLLVFVVVGGSFVFGLALFLRHQRSSEFLERRNVRALAALSSDVALRLDNVATILMNAPCSLARDQYDFQLESAGDETSAATCRTLKERASDALQLLPQVRLESVSPAAPRRGSTPLTTVEATRSSRGTELGFHVVSKPPCIAYPVGSHCPLESAVDVRASGSLDEFLGRLEVGEGLFDDIMLVDSKLNVLLSTSQGQALKRLSGLAVRQGDEVSILEAHMPTGATGRVEIGGTQYRMYAQALPLTWNEAGSDAREGPREATWALYGLVSERHFGFQVADLSFVYGFIASLILLLAVLGWPLLKVVLLGPRERLRSIDVHALLIGTALLTGTVVLFALTADTRVLLQRRTAADLATHAKLMAAALGTEVEDAVHCAMWEGSDVVGTAASGSDDWETTTCQGLHSVVAMDDLGRQIGKRTAQSPPSPIVKHADRSYFRLAAALPQNEPDCEDDGSCQFVVTPILSRSRGDKLTVVSVHAHDDARGVRDMKPVVYMVTTKLASLSQDQIPSRLDFAVVDTAGEVLYHSDNSRSLSENFFLETSGDDRVRNAVRLGTQTSLTFNYRGIERYGYVEPLSLSGMKWSLIVYENVAPIDHASAATLWLGSAFLLLLGGVFIVVFLTHAALRRGRGRWLWPGAGRALPAVLVGVSLASLIALSLAALLDPVGGVTGSNVLRVGVTVPLAALASAYTLLELEELRGRWWQFVRVLPAACVACLFDALSMHSHVIVFATTFLTATYAPSVYTATRRWWPAQGVRSFVLRFAARCETVRDPLYVAALFMLLLATGATPAHVFFTDARHDSLCHLAEVLEPTPVRATRYHVVDGAPCDSDHTPSAQSDEGESGEGDDANDPSLVDAPSTNALRTRVLSNQPGGNDRDDDGAETEESAAAPDARWNLAELVREIVGRTWELVAVRSRARADGSKSATPLSPPVLEATLSPAATHVGLRVLGVSVGTLILLMLVRTTTRLLFGLGFARFPILKQHTPTRGRVLHFGMLRKGFELRIGELRKLGRSVHELDVRRRADLESARELGHVPGGMLVVHHLEACLHDRHWRTRVLDVIESWMLADADQRVEVFTASDPLYIVQETDPSHWGSRSEKEAERERWASILSDMERVHHPPPKPPLEAKDEIAVLLNQECGWHEELHPIAVELHGRACIGEYGDLGGKDASGRPHAVAVNDLMTQIVNRCGPLHLRIWSMCTTAERVFLVQLAEERFVNPRRWMLARRLERRGVIRRDPSFRIVSESFATFLRTTVDRQLVGEWEHHASSRWRQISLPLLFILGCLFAFLWFTQREVIETHIGLLTTVGAGLAGVMRIVEAVRTGKSSAVA